MRSALWLAIGSGLIAVMVLCGGCGTMGWLQSVDEEQVRDLWAEYQRLRDIQSGEIELPVVPANTNVAAVLQDQRAEFLYDNAGVRCMNMAYLGATPDYVESLLDRMQAGGCNVVWIFAENERDGSPLPTTIYADNKFGQVVHADRVKHVRSVLERCRARGLAVVLWLTADDGGAVTSASRERMLFHVGACVENLGDLVDEYVAGLEADEDARRNHMQAMIAECKRLAPDKRCGVHLGSDHWEPAVSWGADVLYYQFGFGQSAQKCAAEADAVICKLNGRAAFVAAEYHKSSDSKEARAIGAAVKALGDSVQGTGNGR